jgi:hypothetical protein
MRVERIPSGVPVSKVLPATLLAPYNPRRIQCAACTSGWGSLRIFR